MNTKELINSLEGEFYTDDIHKVLYATDASAYKESPVGVAYPQSESDIQKLIRFAGKYNITLIPRTAGTSLAGQVVGKGIVVDVSRHFTDILELNAKEKWIRVQPGVVLEELNAFLKPYGLFFGPETSTANRCMIGGMVGNNACGLHSLKYGSTRDHTISLKGFLSDGSKVEFKDLSKEAFLAKTKQENLEGEIYKHINALLENNDNQKQILNGYPQAGIKRRNTGYALDVLLNNSFFNSQQERFNFSQLIAGSEGTLMFVTEIKLNLVEVPPKHKALLCIHHNSLEESLEANLVALKHSPSAVELMDKTILDCTRSNIEQNRNRFFVQGDPEAILILELNSDSKSEISEWASRIIDDMKSHGYGYHYPLIFDQETSKVWNLRKAGLGLLSNIPGDAKPVSVVEDTAVLPSDLPEYIKEFKGILKKYNLHSVYHAHIATGELHLRPVLNLKDADDVDKFHAVAHDVALLVKKYRGSMSGEHGDGRVRGEFIPLVIGEDNYKLLEDLKNTWDPGRVFNDEKIVNTPSMKTNLRYIPGQSLPEIHSYYNFEESGGFIGMAEKCNGSGDCRKSSVIGGVMCPSYMATKDEKLTTRARANVIREFISNTKKDKNPFDHQEIFEILDLCLSCKGCKSECPSNVDMAKLKSEFLQHYYDQHGVPFRSLLIAHIHVINRFVQPFFGIYNYMSKTDFIRGLIHKMIGFAPQRTLPALHRITFRRWCQKELPKLNQKIINPVKSVYVFLDEFTEYNDVEIGIKTIKLLHRLNYKILTMDHEVSGRTYMSKGFVRKAKKIAQKNIEIFANVINENNPLIGIEPSAILSFRDEYPDLASGELKNEAKTVSKNSYLFEEFFVNEINQGNITKDSFDTSTVHILFHGHCQQKAVSSTESLNIMLNTPENYNAVEIKSGCCGMAGSFGYEKEHFELSNKVGELVLFPSVRNAKDNTIICASGTSCRHHILDGTGKKALHPVEVMYKALKSQV